MADSYVDLKWKASPSNAFHGPDADGVQVDTPDASFISPGIRPGWWTPAQVNQGMPYQWGGFSTPTEFERGIRQGKYAGDVCTSAKRRLGNTAVSKHAVGIDCSGLVSRCWRLDHPYSTQELPAICVPLRSFAELKPGDILNSANNHVLIFKAFADAGHQRILAYEAGSPPTWKVLLNSIPVTLLKEQKFQPLRYKQMLD